MVIVFVISILSIVSGQLQSHAENVQITFDNLFGHNHDGINSAKLAANSVNTTQLVTDSVTNSKISGPISVAKGGTGLTSIGSANQILRVNNVGTGLEYATQSSSNSQSGDAVYPLSVSINDYFDPVSATASSSCTTCPNTAINDTQSGVQSTSVYSGYWTRDGLQISSTSSALYNKYVVSVSFWFSKTGNPTGTLTVTIRDSNDAVVATMGTLDVSTLESFFVQKTFSGASHVMTSGDKIVFEYSGGDASNRVNYEYYNFQAYDGTDTIRTSYNGSYTNSATHDSHFEIVYSSGGPLQIFDGNTTSSWRSAKQANPNIYLDFNTAREIVSMAIHLDKTNTNVTSIKIRASADTIFTDSENIAYINVSDFADNTWRFLANNLLSENKRYVQIYGEETGVLSINEVKARYGISDINKIINHFHKKRVTTSVDSFIDSN